MNALITTNNRWNAQLIEKGERDGLAKRLVSRFGPTDADRAARIAGASLEVLELWSSRVAIVNSIDELWGATLSSTREPSALFDGLDLQSDSDIAAEAAQAARAFVARQPEEFATTPATQLRAIGFEQGFARALRETREARRKRGGADTLAAVLRLRFGPSDATREARLEGASIETLMAWGERVLAVESIGELWDD